MSKSKHKRHVDHRHPHQVHHHQPVHEDTLDDVFRDAAEILPPEKRKMGTDEGKIRHIEFVDEVIPSHLDKRLRDLNKR